MDDRHRYSMNSRLFSFLRLFLPVALLICIGAYAFKNSQRAADLAEILADESLNVSLGAAMLERRTQLIRYDLNYLARLNAIEAKPASPAVPDLGRMEKTFIDLLLTKPVYDRLCWINAAGEEVLRVELKAGRALVVAGKRLQNKADQAYFKEAIKRQAGEVYSSPLELKAVNGVLEVPHKPILRLAVAVADEQGEKRGIIVLNYLGDDMISYMKSVTTTVADHLMLVNSAGYFFHAPNPAEEWGFALNEAGHRLAADFSDSWARMADADHGQISDQHGLWTFQSVYPLQQGSHGIKDMRSNELQPLVASELTQRWLVVSHLTPERLEMMLRAERGRIYPLVFLLLAIFAAGAWAIVRAGVAERRAEERFRVYFERAMVGMAMTSLDKQWLTVNPALCTILGYSAEALIGKRWSELTHPDDLAANVIVFERVLRGEAEGYELEKRFMRADGLIVETLIATQLVRKRDGRPDYFIVIVEDISRRVAAQKSQQKLMETLRGFIDYLPGGAFIKDSENRVLVANHHFQEIMGSATGGLDRRPAAGGVAEAVEEVVEQVIGGRVYETTHFPIHHDAGATELGGLMMDITARKKSEKMLEMQARRAAVLLALPEKSATLEEPAFMAYVLDMAEELTASVIGFMHLVNTDNQTIALLAWSTKTLDKYCQAAFDCHYPISQAGIWADAVRQKRPVVINDYAGADSYRGLPEGHSLLLRLISVPVMENGEVRMLTGVGNKQVDYSNEDVETVQLLGNEAWRIVRRQRAERALKIANQVVNASPVVCFRWAPSAGWPVIFVSENVRQWGYLPADLQAGQPPFAEIVHPDDLRRVLDEVISKTVAGSAGYEQEYRIVTPENQLIWVVDRSIVRRDAAGNVLFYDGVLTDITERKSQQLALAKNLGEQKELNRRLEEAHDQLLQSEKMASIGQLAAGIAHELNNPIGFVHSNLGTLDGYVRDLMALIDAYDVLANSEAAASPLLGKINLMREERDFNYIREDIGQLMLESKDGLARVRKIVQDMKRFAHVSEQEWQWADLHQGLDSTLNIVRNELKYKCQVVKVYGDLPRVNCMISQLNQVFMNLLVNAGQAITEQGIITLRTARLGDNEVCIEVSDNGVGIDPDHLTRIFEPFFTTKPVGTGTGLGLSLSYGIVDKHHGRIEVESTLGEGTRFRIILPIGPVLQNSPN